MSKVVAEVALEDVLILLLLANYYNFEQDFDWLFEGPANEPPFSPFVLEFDEQLNWIFLLLLLVYGCYYVEMAHGRVVVVVQTVGSSGLEDSRHYLLYQNLFLEIFLLFWPGFI